MYESQDDNTTILFEATAYTEQQKQKKKKVKPPHNSLYRTWLKNQTPKGNKVTDSPTGQRQYVDPPHTQLQHSIFT